VKAHKTSGGRKMPVRHTIPLGIVIFLVLFVFIYLNIFLDFTRVNDPRGVLSNKRNTEYNIVICREIIFKALPKTLYFYHTAKQ